MIGRELEERLSDLIAFQCVLVALRSLGAEASDEMVWQAFLAALSEQYGFRRIWYARNLDGVLRPAAIHPLGSGDLVALAAHLDDQSWQAESADLTLPVWVEGIEEGSLLIEARDPISAARVQQLRILTAEAAAALADRRFRARSEEALRQARLQAEAAARAKSILLANMSHEIRTPMTGVLGFADLLAGTSLTAEQKDYVETIRSSAGALLGLINDILDFSKIEAGKLSLESAPVDLRNLVEKSVGLLAVQAAGKGLRFGFSVDQATPKTIAGDAMRLRQILLNLLGNAVKFTSEGEVSLTVKPLPEEEGCGRIAFQVRDTGPGIPLEHQQRIFDSFSQVDVSISRKYGGTGLGLAISKTLAEQMGGSLTVDSRPGEGATFHFIIPAHPVAGDAPAPSRGGSLAEIDVSLLPTLRIIVAEDNPVVRAVALSFLKRLGYQPDAAVNGLELLRTLEKQPYDLVFMDVQMPEMDGLEAARQVRKRWAKDQQPRIVAMTAAAFPEDRARCMEAGMDDYITKPVDLAELAEVLKRAKPLSNSKTDKK